MDARKLLDMVKAATQKNTDYFSFAAAIVEAQKEEDALIAEAMNCQEVAQAIRA